MTDNNVKTTILKPVFIPSVLFIIILVAFTIMMPTVASEVFSSVKNFVAEKFGWLYMLSVGIFTLFVLFLAISPFGKFKLGPDQSKPVYSNLSWFAMLFSAGMGIGLVFWGVAEPLNHFMAPLNMEAGTSEAANFAIYTSFFHWGIHPWANYSVIALALAYMQFRKGKPGLISSIFIPLLG